MTWRCKLGSLILLTVFGVTGCATARVVSKDAEGGIVAIPENSNGWPCRYRDKALELVKQDCPHGYVVLKEEEVPTGTRTVDSDSSDGTMHTIETYTDREYRIYYRRASGPRTVVIPELRHGPLAHLETPAPLAPPSALPPQPIPITQ